ncbi:hypothetical protein SK069_01225 [Patulibacter brassicae]|uniref:Secreted protein n=1 Tax=Patulibacter brassicae TaxID=1705717 RepID=A0ABU4VEL6_9ACTN|nr:hypothetical protein [Patulibacter brassicae]MDX8150202.1 hypothetical protein [Patulibacter brassicae]
MGPMAIRAHLARTNQRLLALLAVLVLAGSVVAHHGAPHSMGAMDHGGGDHQTAAAAMCVGTIAATIAIVGLVATVVRRRRRRTLRPVRALLPVVVRLVPTAPLARARSSPLYLQYAVLRR